MLFIKQYYCFKVFPISIFRSILYYLTKYGFKGSQLLHISKAVWGRLKRNSESVIVLK